MTKQNRRLFSVLCIVAVVCFGVAGLIRTTQTKAEAEPPASFYENRQRSSDVSEYATLSDEATFSSTSTTPDTLFEIPIFTYAREGQRITHLGYTVHFNSEWLIPNWVAYQLTCTEVNGEEERSKSFKPDPDVSGICPTTKDYTNSGYDRGHMAPAADMKWSEQAMKESFYLTNICPQNHNLNAGDWKTLEEKVRDWACEYGPVYVVCGPIVTSEHQVIGEVGVTVPKGFFKALLCRKNGQWQAIGFVFDNIAGHKALSSYAKSIDEVEELTGMDFFFLLDDKTENAIEATCNPKAWEIYN